MTEIDLLAHAAYAVLLVSFLMRDILWLRVFSVVSISLVIPFYYLQPERGRALLGTRHLWRSTSIGSRAS